MQFFLGCNWFTEYPQNNPTNLYGTIWHDVKHCPSISCSIQPHIFSKESNNNWHFYTHFYIYYISSCITQTYFRGPGIPMNSCDNLPMSVIFTLILINLYKMDIKPNLNVIIIFTWSRCGGLWLLNHIVILARVLLQSINKPNPVI